MRLRPDGVSQAFQVNYAVLKDKMADPFAGLEPEVKKQMATLMPFANGLFEGMRMLYCTA
jgi:hypothetical protein